MPSRGRSHNQDSHTRQLFSGGYLCSACQPLSGLFHSLMLHLLRSMPLGSLRSQTRTLRPPPPPPLWPTLLPGQPQESLPVQCGLVLMSFQVSQLTVSRQQCSLSPRQPILLHAAGTVTREHCSRNESSLLTSPSQVLPSVQTDTLTIHSRDRDPDGCCWYHRRFGQPAVLSCQGPVFLPVGKSHSRY